MGARIAAALAAGVLSAGLAGCAMSDPYSGSDVHTARTPAGTLPAVTATTPAGGTVVAAPRVPRAAARAARAFTAGYVRYLYGQLHAGHLADATPALRALLAKRPPRLPRTVHAPRVVLDRLALSVTATGVVAIASYHAASTHGLASITLTPAHGRWLVVAADNQTPQD